MPELLIEIGTEEIPAGYAMPALAAMARAMDEEFAASRLAADGVTVLGTPRRLTLHFASVAERGEDATEERTGPAARIAFDADGAPTRAAIGFARSAGVAPEELRTVSTKKGDYVAATVTREGEPAAEVVARAVAKALAAVPFPKSMRWTGSELAFARPIRNLVALLGEAVVPVEVAGLVAGRESRGHPFLAPGPVALASAGLDEYRRRLAEARVLVDPAERKARIRELLAPFCTGEIAPLHEGLLEEVTWLVEWPDVVEGAIDPAYLELPVEVLETAMRVHLRFFPVLRRDGRPEPRFLSVTNREPSSAAVVREGNERVLRSRLSDARFFLAEDRKRTLESRVADLDGKALHRDLGSYGEKAKRLAELAGRLAAEIGGPSAVDPARRAGLLAKTDLLTEMVGEFPELQGTVGRIYATLDGESDEVAAAIEDHYRPRGPGDDLPRGPVSAAVAIAEKLDNLAGFFRISGAPSGSSDPFGLRRQTLGVIRTSIEGEISFALGRAIGVAVEGYGAGSGEGLAEGILDFLRERLYQASVDEGFRYDLVRAVLAAGFDDLPDFRARLLAMHAVAEEPWWPRLVEVVERTHNILRGAEVPAAVDQARLEEDEERALHAAVLRWEGPLRERLGAGDYETFAREFADAFADVVHAFFEKVYVNVEDEARRGNRLALLARVNALFAGAVADLSSVDRGEEGAAG